MLKVVKFGGTSLAEAKQFVKVAGIIKADSSRRYVVPSAPGKRFGSDTKVTDMFYSCYDTASKGGDFSQTFESIKKRYNDIISELGLDMSLEKEFEKIHNNFIGRAGRDYAASRGEYLNGHIVAKLLGFEFIDAADVIFFDEEGKYDAKKTLPVLRERLQSAEHAVIPGFYGSMPNDTIRTFSRGGSDITGSIVAAAADADLYENWTDVSGFLLADPRVVKNPQVIKSITYRELRELSYMGATVIHEDAIFPVMQKKIPIRIKNTNAPEDEGTLILADTDEPAEHTVTGIAGRNGFSSINIEKYMINNEPGAIRRVLEVLEDHKVSFEHIPSGIDNFSIVVSSQSICEDIDDIVYDIKKVTGANSVTVENSIAVIAVVGRSMKSTCGVASTIFGSLAKENINIKMIDQGSSEINVVLAVAEHDYERTINAIYNAFVKKQ